MRRYWFVQASAREIRALVCLEQERQNLRQEWHEARADVRLDPSAEELP